MGRKARSGDLPWREAAEQLNRIYFRDHGICRVCWRFCLLREASREHVIALSRGGSSDDSNVVLAHKSCNAMRNWIDRAIYTTIRRVTLGYPICGERRNPGAFAPFSRLEDKPND